MGGNNVCKLRNFCLPLYRYRNIYIAKYLNVKNEEKRVCRGACICALAPITVPFVDLFGSIQQADVPTCPPYPVKFSDQYL